MGCDIHVRVQQKNRTGEWVDHERVQVDFDRNYALFSALADVRNYNGLTPIFEQRGLPKSVIDSEYVGDHSFTWFTIEELVKWNGWDQHITETETLRDWCGQFLSWLDYARTYFAYRLDKVRLVVGFDS